jgi:hypothetical protein
MKPPRRGDIFHLNLEVPILCSGKHPPTFRANMISFFAILLRLFFKIFRSNRTILSENALLKKENDIG